jgi:group II intron reverse transcriptase/maturase
MERKMTEIPSSTTVCTKLQRIAKLAQEMPETALTSLSHHIDIEWLREAWHRTRKDAAVGVDGQTARDYEANLEANLRSLLDRAKSGRYHAPPVRRVYIPKGQGPETRPIGIPTLEDKVLQRVVAMALEAVYEQEFLPCSWGFRPNRSAHGALAVLWKDMMDMHGGWVLEVDIRRFFDTLVHSHLRKILRQRVRDGVLLRLIGKWLKAGVLEGGSVSYPRLGTPQGGVISPLLANIYLHEVLDKWLVQRVAPRLRGRVVLTRYADDFVLLFAREDDAKRVYAALPRRLTDYGLELHPTKTRLIEFKQPQRGCTTRPKDSFDLLGFTHFWSRSRRNTWIVQRRTAKDRFTRSVQAIRRWCREHRHDLLARQHEGLCRRILGHYAYFGITGNAARLSAFRDEAQRAWRKWLDRRCYKADMKWDKFHQLLRTYSLPRVRIVHTYRSP